jgi:hypothetical protein
MRISPFAASYVRKRTTEHMVDRCKIWTPGDVVIDDDGRATRSESVVKYEGPCRFWEVNAGQQIVVGDEQISMTSSFLTLPYNAVIPEQDDVVQITASVDNDLVGRVVNITGVMRGGGLRASRKFTVQVVESKKPNW